MTYWFIDPVLAFWHFLIKKSNQVFLPFICISNVLSSDIKYCLGQGINKTVSLSSIILRGVRMYSFMWKSLAFADKCAMKLTCQVWNVSTQDTHNLTMNSPCQNVSYELLQCDHITPTPVHKLTFGCPKQLDREPQPHNQFKSNWAMLWSQNAMIPFFMFYSADSRRSLFVCETPWRLLKNQITYTVSFSLAHTCTHTNTHFRSMHSKIHQSSVVCSRSWGWGVLFLGRGWSLFTGNKHAKANILETYTMHTEKKGKKHTNVSHI